MTKTISTDGLQYKRFDLHVHTTGSSDFQDQTVTAAQIVQAAIDAGLDAIAVTDHNSGAMVDAVKEAAEETALTIFPGVEIKVGQVHVIALLDIDKTSADISSLLSSLDIQISEQGNIEAISSLTVEQAAAVIKKHSGLTVLAHVNGSNGAMRVITGKAKTSIMKDPLICAAEVTDYDETTGKSATAELLRGNSKEFGNRILATYCASDNPTGADTGGHGIQGIGKRSSFFKVENINLRSLRQCFLDPEVRIAQHIDPKAFAHIDSIKITGGYFDGKEASFHNGLNTLIGGKGAGKSLLVELLRFGLDKQPDVREVRDDHDTKLSAQLKMYSQVEIAFTDDTGTQHTVIRKYDSGSNHPYDSEEQRLAAVDFPVLFLSQNEIIAIAQHPQAQLAFVDQFFNFQHHATTIEELERKISEYDTQLASVITAMRSTTEVQKAYRNTTAQIEEIDKQLKSPVFDKYYTAELKKRALDAQRQQLVDASSQLQELGKKEVFKVQSLPNGLEADPALLRTRDEIERVSLSIGSIVATERAKITSALEIIDKEIAGFSSSYQGALTAYQIYVRSTGGTKPALAKKRAELVLKQQAEAQKIASLKLISDEKDSVVSERKKLLSQLQEAHKEYTTARQKKFANLQSRSGGRLKLTLYPGENKDIFKKRLLSLKRGSYMREAEIAEICEKVEPGDFVRVILNYLVTGKPSFINDFATKNDIDPAKLLSLVDFLVISMELEDLLKLQYEAQPQDRPEIEYNTGVKGASFYRPLSQLSTGQKCTALLVIALCDGGMPVVIDQPEDSLDIKTVWEDMCLKIRSSKVSRQFVFTTHNSSLAVASDSDKFLVITGTADSGDILMAGSMDNDEMRLEVIKHLEGDKVAYKKKYVKYELDDINYTA